MRSVSQIYRHDDLYLNAPMADQKTANKTGCSDGAFSLALLTLSPALPVLACGMSLCASTSLFASARACLKVITEKGSNT